MNRDRTPSPPEPKRLGVLSGALLGGWLALGAVLCDVLIYLGSGEPDAFLELVPGSLVAVLVTAAIGALLGASPVLAFAIGALFFAGSIATEFRSFPVSNAVAWFPRIGLLLWFAWIAARWIHRRRSWSLAQTGLALGFACMLVALLYRQYPRFPSRFMAASGGALVVLLLNELRHSPARRLATLVVVALACWPTLRLVSFGLRPRRPDTAGPTTAAQAPAPNLLFIVLDTVRADHLAPYGYERVTTPGIDAFVQAHATRYERAYSASSWTLPSHGSLFTGVPPGLHQATTTRTAPTPGTIHLQSWPGEPVSSEFPTLAELLANDGYHTAAFVGNCFFMRPEFGLARGFQHYDARAGAYVGYHLALAQLTGRRLHVGHRGYRSATSITDRALDWLGNDEERPFFLFLNYFDAHDPYLPAAPFDRAFSDARPTDPLRPEDEIDPLLYDRELLGLDAQVTRVLDALRENGVFEETVVVITSDHGEALGEHGIPNHSWTLYEEMIHVPLYVKPAGERAQEVHREPIQGTEVFGLTLELLGRASLSARDTPAAPGSVWPITGEWYHCGKSRPELLAGMERATGLTLGRDVVTWSEEGIKFIVSSKGDVEAYDLASDPDEARPLELARDKRESARERARAWWNAHPPPEPRSALSLSAEELERLEAVGYAGEE